MKTERFEMRLDPQMVARIDAWRRRQEDLPSRAEAIRRLIEASLGGDEPSRSSARPKPRRRKGS
jgi:metal-responsive CopG/Arc/MetJ family transcriptional regulator